MLAVALVAALSAQSPPPAPAPRPASDDFVAPGPVTPLPAPIAAAADAIRAEALAAHIALLASPALEGRGLGSRGLEAAAEYIAATLAIAGVPPLDGPRRAVATAAYFHPVPMREIRSASGEIVVDAWRGDSTFSRTFRSGVDALFAESGPEEVSAPVAFAGYGIRESAPERDDYRLLDVKDKLVVILAGLPPAAEWQTAPLREKYDAPSGRERFAAKAAHARAAGAIGVIAIEAGDFAVHLDEEAKRAPAAFFLPHPRDATWQPGVVRVTPVVGDALLGPAGLTTTSAATADPRDLRGVTVTLRVTGEERLLVGRNVVAVLRGSDAALADQAVVVGAHMDHLGRRGDVIHFGADDNASGVASLLEMAKAMAGGRTRPKRTVVFAFWTGEEEGHLGSDHYVRHPSWPLEQTVAYLNLDMVGHPWKADEIRQLVTDVKLPNAQAFLAKTPPDDFLEVGLAEWAPELAPLIVRAARGTGVGLHVDRGDGKHGGSDYRAFARRDLPWLRFFGNFFEGYHEPIDTADRLDAAQVRKMARLALATAWLIADR